MSTRGELSNAPIFPEPPPPSGAREFEFGDAENKVFSGLSSGMQAVGVAQIATGVGLFLIAVAHVWMGGPPAMISSVPMAMTGAMFAVTGLWLRKAATPIARIVSTQGSDIRNLMEAMGGLAQMFALQRVFFLAAGVLTVLAVVAVVVMMMFFGELVHAWLG